MELIRAAVRALRAFASSGPAPEVGIDPATGALWSRLAADDGSGTPLGVTATDLGAGKVGLDVNAPTGGLPTVDQGVALISAGDVDCTGAAKLTATTGAGYITVTNRDPVNTIYLGLAAVSGAANGEALLPGSTRSWRSSNLALEYGIGSLTVNVSVRR